MAEDSLEKGFEGLACYREGNKLLQAAYRTSKSLPDHEKFNLASQLRRAALSTLLNIAEGYGRYHYLDKIRFFYHARGSLCETLSAFIVAFELNYISQEQLDWVREVETSAEKSLNGYIAFLRSKQQGAEEFGTKHIRDDIVEYRTQKDDDFPLDSPEP